MSRRAMWIEKAKKEAKKRYGGMCIVTCQPHPDAAHIYPAGTYPELSTKVDNIIPLSRAVHTAMDSKSTNGEQRIEFISPNVHIDFKQQFWEQIERLREIKEKMR